MDGGAGPVNCPHMSGWVCVYVTRFLCHDVAQTRVEFHLQCDKAAVAPRALEPATKCILEMAKKSVICKFLRES